MRPICAALVVTLVACQAPNRPDPALRAALIQRAEADQGRMQELAAHWGDSGYHAVLATTLLDNARWLDSLVAAGGWPGFARVDSDGAAAAYLIAQHADTLPAAQQRFLEALRQAVQAEDARPVDLAYLEDRVRKAQGRPQRFGTQPAYDSAGVAVQPEVESPDSLDILRAAVGLPPMAEYLEQMRAMNARLRAARDTAASR